jgi:hypothetical protein
MAWTVCPTCGLRFSTARRGCPRCTGGGSRKGGTANTLSWWFLGVLVVLALWRSALGLADANRSGDFSHFWSIFFGGD